MTTTRRTPKPIDNDDLAAVLAAVAMANAAMDVDLGKLGEEIEEAKTDRERMADRLSGGSVLKNDALVQELRRKIKTNQDGRIRNAKGKRGKRTDGKRRVKAAHDRVALIQLM